MGYSEVLEISLPADVDAERFRAHVWHESYEHGVAVRVTRSAQVVSVFFYPALAITRERMQEGLRQLATAVRRVTGMTLDNVTSDLRTDAAAELTHAGTD